MVENAATEGDKDGGGNVNSSILAFQKLCPRICKLLNGQNFQVKAALLGMVVGAVAPQNLESLLQSINECLGSPDWATRKAAADSLCALGFHSSKLIAEGPANSILIVLEDCRFHKVSAFQCPLS